MVLLRRSSKQQYRCFFFLLLSLLFVFPVYAQESDLESVNRNNVQRFVDEVYNKGNLNVINILFTEDVVGYPGERSRQDYADSVIGLRAAMPDLSAETTVTIVENDWLAFQLLLHGTFSNEMVFPNNPPIPPTNTEIQFVVNMAMHTNPQGQVTEYWVGFDNLSFLAQIDFIPRPETLWQGNTDYVPLMQTGQEDANKLRILEYYNAWQTGDYGTVQAQLSDDFVAYNPFGSFDRDGQINDMRLFREAFPDYTWDFKAVIAEGNYAVVVHQIKGTFSNNYTLAENVIIPPTNRPLDLTRVDFLRFNEQGLIAETWELYDVWDFLSQLDIPFATSN